MQDKRGLSAIVATLIIILLVLVAAGIVWVVVRNIITEGTEGIELGRFTFDLSIRSAYIDGTNVKVTVKRNSGGGDLVGVRFIFFNGTGSIIVNRNIPLIELQEELFIFDSNDVGDINALQRVSVAPIYELSSGTETIGDITDTATISDSPPPGGNGGNGGNGGTGPPDTGYCGDNIIQNPNGNGELEICDRTSLGGENCISQGFDGGTLACNVDCLAFDTFSCTSQAPASCNGSWNPPEDPGVECDGGANCNLDCTCPTGFTADTFGGCTLNPLINNGTIYSVWPIGAVKYFDSEDLPIDVSGYTMYYVNFSNSAENGCFRITWAEYMDTNGRSYIRTEFMVNISVGEVYNVWEAENCGA
jgi:hypothetical protein